MAVLRVAGTCKTCGHKVETDAQPGRATWRGDCPRQGCIGKITATRIRTPTKTATPPPATSPDGGTPASKPPAPAAGKPRRRAVKASYAPRAKSPAGAPAPTGAPKPAKRPAPGPAAGGPGAGPDDGPGKPATPPAPRSDRTEDGRHHGHPAARYGFDLW